MYEIFTAMEQYLWVIPLLVVVSLFFVGIIFRTARFRAGRHLNDLSAKCVIFVDHFNSKNQPMVRVVNSCSSRQRKRLFPLSGTERIHLRRGNYHVCDIGGDLKSLVRVQCAPELSPSL